jgi:hypothetical protein
MPITINDGAPTLLIRRSAFERVGLTRADIDDALGLTADEFAVEGDLIAVGPLHTNDGLERGIELFEARGLEMFDDFIELSGNWPSWITLFAMGR